MKKRIIIVLVGMIILSLTTGCNQSTNDVTKKEESNGNCTIIECMKKIKATNTMEEINAIIGFETTTDAMIGSDPIWKFDSKNWISFKTSNDDTTIQATIDKESIKDENIKLPTQKELQELLNKGINYEEMVKTIGGEGTLTSISKNSVSYTWVDETGVRLGTTCKNDGGKCSVASYR